MSLNSQIKEDIKNAMRNKEVQKRDTLRNIQTLIKQIEVDERRVVSDSDVETILMRYIKQREDAIGQFSSGGRDDLVEKEKVEIEIIRAYLPQPLSDKELEVAMREIISTIGATSMKDMAKIMSSAKEIIGSKADGGRINKCVKIIFS
ncbi:MAG: glutamyl-tRNA amidotransferase [Sulfurovum sp. AS07-7]|nr:MAG: glutamyl-tRNA amidotransferase [Sulfurovum sp. AS07-7]